MLLLPVLLFACASTDPGSTPDSTPDSSDAPPDDSARDTGGDEETGETAEDDTGDTVDTADSDVPAEIEHSPVVMSLDDMAGRLVGERAADYAGEVLAPVGDLTGDGVDDLLVGAAFAEREGNEYDGWYSSGKAYIWSGIPSGDESAAASYSTFLAEDEGGQLGSALASGGDADGSGGVDVWMSAPALDAAGADAGRVYLLSDPTAGGVEVASALLVVDGPAAGDGLGAGLAAGFDYDGDGAPDAALAAPGSDLGSADGGTVWLLTAPFTGSEDLDGAAATWTSDLDGAYAGRVLAAVSDADGDGLDELLVGASMADQAAEGSGLAWLVLGGMEGAHTFDDADAVFAGGEADDATGRALAGDGDLDGDGLGDLAIGVPGASDVGEVWIFHGAPNGSHDRSTADAVLSGSRAGDSFGHAVAFVSDADGDTRDELLVGVPEADYSTYFSEGAACLFYGDLASSRSAADADVTLTGVYSDDFAGIEVAAADLDGDGRGDLAVGSRAGGGGNTVAGVTYVLSSAGLP